MGNITLIGGSWYIASLDKILVRDLVELQQLDGTWKQIKVGINKAGEFHEVPNGVPFNNLMFIRRLNIRVFSRREAKLKFEELKQAMKENKVIEDIEIEELKVFLRQGIFTAGEENEWARKIAILSNYNS